MATCEHSSGVAKAGLTTGIIGTSLAGLWALGAGNGNGLLGGLFGGNCNGGVMAAQGAYQAALSAKDAEIGQLKAERYADSVGTGVYAQLNSQMKEAYQELVVTRERLARNETEFGCLQRDVSRISGQVAALDAEAVNNRVNNQKTADALECLAKSTNDQFANVYRTIDSKVQLEAERRECGDHRIFEYVNCNYVKAQKKISKDDICPEVMPRWNSWTAPTGEAPAVQPISGSVNISRK